MSATHTIAIMETKYAGPWAKTICTKLAHAKKTAATPNRLSATRVCGVCTWAKASIKLTPTTHTNTTNGNKTLKTKGKRVATHGAYVVTCQPFSMASIKQNISTATVGAKKLACSGQLRRNHSHKAQAAATLSKTFKGQLEGSNIAPTKMV